MALRRRRLKYIGGAAVLVAVLLAAVVYLQYRTDLDSARDALASGSRVAETACGPIEYSDTGAGPAVVLAVHGAGGGYFQMEGFARRFAADGFRVVSVSRFGYLRTPMPADATPEAQAAAHACVLDALRISKAAVIGVSAGAPSSLRFCSRYADRCQALVLLVPAAYAPEASRRETTPPSPYMQFVLDYVLQSDFVMWAMVRLAPGILVETALATPRDVFRQADDAERARALAIVRSIFPVSPKLDGLRNDMKIASGLRREELENIHAPTLAISAEDDLYGTLAGARYATQNIRNARLVAYPTGGHAWLGHDTDVINEILRFLRGAVPA
jgi:pimeloyl-ACP methyl ester carboxylesterase